jgi:hypothetical protein
MIMEAGINIREGFDANHGSFISWSGPSKLMIQFDHTEQVIGGRHEPACQLRSQYSFIASAPKASNRLHPPKDLFHSLSRPLTQLIPDMPRRPFVNRRTSTALPILSHMRPNASTSQHRHKPTAIIPFISTHGPRENPLPGLTRPRLPPCRSPM